MSSHTKSWLPLGVCFCLGLLLSSKAIAQHSDPELHAEHMAAINLISDAMITNTVVQSGLWSNSSTWQNGASPSAGANISVPENLRLEVDVVSDTNFNTLRVDGELYFSNNRNCRIGIPKHKHSYNLHSGQSAMLLSPQDAFVYALHWRQT